MLISTLFLLLQELKTQALSMLTEAVFDGSQAMRDPVGGSVEFHFVPILKLISTLLIMGIFNNEDVKHILKMIEPSVFGKKEEAGETEEPGEEAASKEEGEEVKEKEEAAEGEEEEAVDEGVGEEEEDEELKALKKEGGEEGEEVEKASEEEGEKVDGEKAEEEKEAEEVGEEVKEEEEEAPEEGLLQMKLPESVKLQVNLIYRLLVSSLRNTFRGDQ